MEESWHFDYKKAVICNNNRFFYVSNIIFYLNILSGACIYPSKSEDAGLWVSQMMTSILLPTLTAAWGGVPLP